MKFRKLYALIFILFTSFYFSQETDTIIIYEKVVVYDTIYVEQEQPVESNEITQRNMQRIPNSDWDFGISAIGGVKNVNFFSKEKKNQYGFGGGLFIQNTFLDSRLTLALEANYLYWMTTVDVDANQEDSILNGFYFMGGNEPILFQSFDDKHTEISVPLKLYFNIGNFSPFMGIYGTYTSYKMGFLVPENGEFQNLAEYKTENYSYGFVGGIKYHLNNFSFSLEYRQNELNDLTFESEKANPFMIDFPNAFRDQKFLLGIHYSFGD